MDLQNSTNQAVPVIRPCPQQLGCAVIDEQGNEILITEEMIQQACLELEQRLVKPAKQG